MVVCFQLKTNFFTSNKTVSTYFIFIGVIHYGKPADGLVIRELIFNSRNWRIFL
jgi:hypothetical protein